jgi:hypothetical protein
MTFSGGAEEERRSWDEAGSWMGGYKLIGEVEAEVEVPTRSGRQLQLFLTRPGDVAEKCWY